MACRGVIPSKIKSLSGTKNVWRQQRTQFTQGSACNNIHLFCCRSFERFLSVIIWKIYLKGIRHLECLTTTKSPIQGPVNSAAHCILLSWHIWETGLRPRRGYGSKQCLERVFHPNFICDIKHHFEYLFVWIMSD